MHVRCIFLTPVHAMHHAMVHDTGVQGKALYFASKGVDSDWVELLLEQDAALDFTDGDGKTALDVAANREIKSLLKVTAFSRAAYSVHAICLCVLLLTLLHVPMCAPPDLLSLARPLWLSICVAHTLTYTHT